MAIAYIVGAGTSVCAKAPLMADFRRRATTLLQIDGDADGYWAPEHSAFPTSELRTMFQEALDFWHEVSIDANVEEFYIAAELAERLTGGPYINAAQYMIAKTLQMSMSEGVTQEHLQFVQNVWFSSQEKTGQPPAVISLNWDLAMDSAIKEKFSSIWYGFGDDAAKKDGFRLYKLHGSLNWWYCLDCHRWEPPAQIKSVLAKWEGPGMQCLKCNKKMTPIFTPPSPQKMDGATATALAPVWNGAKDELANCKQLAIVGYSFPAGDLQFKMFVLQAIAKNQQLDKICIITNPKFGSVRQAFEDHFASIFRGSSHYGKLVFRYLEFEEWSTKDKCRLFEAARLG